MPVAAYVSASGSILTSASPLLRKARTRCASRTFTSAYACRAACHAARSAGSAGAGRWMRRVRTSFALSVARGRRPMTFSFPARASVSSSRAVYPVSGFCSGSARTVSGWDFIQNSSTFARYLTSPITTSSTGAYAPPKRTAPVPTRLTVFGRRLRGRSMMERPRFVQSITWSAAERHSGRSWSPNRLRTCSVPGFWCVASGHRIGLPSLRACRKKRSRVVGSPRSAAQMIRHSTT